MIRTLLTIVLFMVIASGSTGQANDEKDIARNGFYLETYILRHDFSEGIASLNYERSIGKKRNATIRIGIYPDFESTVSFPVTLTWVTTPLSRHHFEYGIGGVYRLEHFISDYNPDREWYHDIPALMIPVMYRFQKEKGFYLRAGINLFVSWPVLPSPSISAGYRF